MGRRWLKRLLALLLLALVLWEGILWAQILWWKTHNPEQTSFMEISVERRLKEHRGPLLPHPWTPWSAIPASLKQAVIAAEDSAFVSHYGFDFEGMKAAVQKDARKGRWVAGGSTITQQLAKNLFLSGHRSLWRKAQEAVITLMIETTWSKRRILEVYLNVIEWGDGVYGCEAAALHYYQRPVSALGAAESADLAVRIPRPRWFENHGEAESLQEKRAVILDRMNRVAIPH
jgi:monofunctional biosynthetic peptidoglycan transglycosylase